MGGPRRVCWRGDLCTMRSIVFRIKSAVISPYYTMGEAEPGPDINWDPLLSVLETQMRQAARREGVVLHRNHLDLAYDFRHRRSHDARDKYYAIMSIIENDQGAELCLRPSYEISLEELHRQFIAEIQRIGEIEDVHVVNS